MRDKAIVCVCRHLRIQLVAGPQSAFICSTARGRRPRRLQWSHTMRGQSLTTSIELARAALYIYICRSSGLSLPLKRPPLCSCYTLPPPHPTPHPIFPPPSYYDWLSISGSARGWGNAIKQWFSSTDGKRSAATAQPEIFSFIFAAQTLISYSVYDKYFGGRLGQEISTANVAYEDKEE